MKDETQVVESFEQAFSRLMVRLPLAQRLAGLAPEQRLAGLAPEQVLGAYAPEQRLAGLSEEQTVLALPDAMLRGFSEEYLATLPPKTRALIKKRLAKAAPAPAPAKRRTRR